MSIIGIHGRIHIAEVVNFFWPEHTIQPHHVNTRIAEAAYDALYAANISAHPL